MYGCMDVCTVWMYVCKMCVNECIIDMYVSNVCLKLVYVYQYAHILVVKRIACMFVCMCVSIYECMYVCVHVENVSYLEEVQYLRIFTILFH
jgi:hypothetical protein